MNDLSMLLAIIGTYLWVVIAILVLIVIIPYLLNAFAVKGFAKAAGYDKPALAFVPFGPIQAMVFQQAANGISGDGPSSKASGIVGYGMLICFILSFVPVIGMFMAIPTVIMGIVAFIFNILSVSAVCRYTGRGAFLPIFCMIFVPIFGFMITCNILKNSL